VKRANDEILLPQLVGWYGKLPARGDFLGHGLPRAWQRLWDEWLQRAMAGASRQVDAALLRERLLAMSPWQCVVVTGDAREPAWSVVVIATTDRVGRVFPLLMAEAYEAGQLDRIELQRLRARALPIAQWLREAAPVLTPREFESGVMEWASAAWPEPDADPPPGSHVTLSDLRHSRPNGRSFWWRLDPAASGIDVLDEPWPPRDSMLLEWLAVTD
jgi:type VI secretion system protein ImpM